MTLVLGNVDVNSTLYIPFHTFDSNGASITITGLATSDIEIYKNGSATTRSSDNGYTLLDTDGIDFNSKTGIHGFSVDLSNNSDAGFYAAGASYFVVVSTITVDTRTVSFVAAHFNIGFANVDVVEISGDSAAADNCELFFDGTGYAGTGNTIPTVTTLTNHTAQTGDSFARIGAAGASLTDLGGMSSGMKTEITTAAANTMRKNVALANFTFLMTENISSHPPMTGLTVTGTVSIDGASYTALTNSVSEIGTGMYKVSLAAADMNGDVIALRFTGAGADDTNVTIVTQP